MSCESMRYSSWRGDEEFPADYELRQRAFSNRLVDIVQMP